MQISIRCPSEDSERLPELCAMLGVPVPITFRDRVILSELLRVIYDVGDEVWWANRPAHWAMIQEIRASYDT